MASKVCPVCKTFSSSSNTTLNAHIDRCLSDESKIKCTSNSKVIKHKIKPRKTRLMVDIYETAPHCTLEDLDRRNGTKWALNLECPAEALVVSADEKNKTHPVDIQYVKESSANIDSNSRKLHVLSKFRDSLLKSNAIDDCRSRKLIEKDKGRKFLLNKRENCLIQKHKLLKFCSHGQKSSYPRLDRCFKARDGQQRRFPMEEGYKNEDPTQHLKKYDQMQSNDFAVIKQWIGSKQTGVKNKMNLKCKNQQRTSTSNLTPVGDTYAKRINDSISQILRNSQDECEEQPYLLKTVGSSFLGSQDLYVNKAQLFPNCKVKQLRKDVPYVCRMEPSSSTKNHVSHQSNKKTGANNSAIGDFDGPFISTRMPHDHMFSSRAKKLASPRKTLDREIPPDSNKFSSFKKNRLSLRHTSVPESKKTHERKLLDFKKLTLQYMSESDEQAIVSQKAVYGQDNLIETPCESSPHMENGSDESSINRTRFLKRNRRQFINTCEEGDIDLKSSDTFESDNHGAVAKNHDPLVGHSVPSAKSIVRYPISENEKHDLLIGVPTSNAVDREASATSCKSLSSPFPFSSDVECVSQHYIKAYENHLPPRLVLGNEKKMSCADKVGIDLITDNTHVMAEIDAIEGQQICFVDDDPVPIPGPPESFLPSPGHMASEELGENSSLTTCRIQRSSEGEHEFVDMDSSDSPVSTPSMVSNYVAATSNPVSFVNFSEQSHNVQHETRCDISEDRIESHILSHQDLRYFRRQATTSFPFPVQEKEIAGGTENTFSSFNLRSESMPEEKPTYESETNIVSSPTKDNPALVSTSFEAKFPASGKCEFPSPSRSNFVLRLMGQNLIVTNKDDNCLLKLSLSS